MECIWQPFWILQEKVGISFYFWIIMVVNSQHCRVMSDVTPPDTPETPPKHPPNDSNRFQVLELIVSFQGCWTQWQRFESSSMHYYWDTPHHFPKTHFCLENGFLLFLELQKSLLVSFQGCWTQWQRFESFTVSEILHCIFSKHVLAQKVASCHC